MSLSEYIVNGHPIAIEQTVLAECEDEDEGVPAFFFAAENLAAQTGQKVWETAPWLLRELEARDFVAGLAVVELVSSW